MKTIEEAKLEEEDAFFEYIVCKRVIERLEIITRSIKTKSARRNVNAILENMREDVKEKHLLWQVRGSYYDDLVEREIQKKEILTKNI